MVENGLTSPDELMKALKRYLEESGETERSAASRIGVNRHTIHRWLSEKESPKKVNWRSPQSFSGARAICSIPKESLSKRPPEVIPGQFERFDRYLHLSWLSRLGRTTHR